MPGSRSSNNESEHKSPRESGDDSEDESEILEESPCGRWLKRKEEVSELSPMSIGRCFATEAKSNIMLHSEGPFRVQFVTFLSPNHPSDRFKASDPKGDTFIDGRSEAIRN